MNAPEYKSDLERKYAAFLTSRVEAGEVADFGYEVTKFRLDHGVLKYPCTYTPDFTVLLPDGTVEYHETKGFMREDAMVKLKIAAAQHPESSFIIVTYKNKRTGWQFKPVERAWETKKSKKHIAALIQDCYKSLSSHSASILQYIYHNLL